MSEEIENIPLDEYPVQIVPGKFALLKAKTLYKFQNDNKTDGRWLAICKCESTFMKRDNTEGKALSIRIYRWQWRQVTKWDPDQRKRIPTSEYRWFQEQQTNLSRKDYWDKIKNVVDEYMKEI